MICYRLRSCNIEEYPDINNICWDSIIADVGQIVYINNNPSQTYLFEIVGENACICQSLVPPYVVDPQGDCKLQPTERAFLIENCTDSNDQREVILEGVPVIVGSIIEVQGESDCFIVLQQIPVVSFPTYTVLRRLGDCSECGQAGFIYNFIDCETETQTLVARVFTQLDSPNVVTFLEIEGCWRVVGQDINPTQDLSVINRFKNCNDCLEPSGAYLLRSCLDGAVVSAMIQGLEVNVGEVITVAENGDCWEVMEEVVAAINTLTKTGTLSGCQDCDTSAECSEDNERTLAFASKVKLPTPQIPNKDFKECCYENIVLASLGDSDGYKNDYTGVYFQRQTQQDDVDFILRNVATGDEYDLNDTTTYGIFKDFGDVSGNQNLSTYIVEWRKVLNLLGEGVYEIEKNMTVAGLNFVELTNTFQLVAFSNEVADKSVRIDCVMDGELVHLGVNFKGSEFKTSLRTKGFFGRRNPTYTQDNLVRRNYKAVQISMSQQNEYQFQTGLIPECITEDLYDFVLFGNELFISDYNLNNHSYKLREYAVEFDGNKGASYYVYNRDSRVNLTFVDRVKDKRKLNC